MIDDRQWQIGFPADSRRASTEDTGLFGSDFFACFAQPFLMIQCNGGQYRHIRVNQVDGIEAPPQAHLQHGNIKLGAGKEVKGD